MGWWEKGEMGLERSVGCGADGVMMKRRRPEFPGRKMEFNLDLRWRRNEGSESPLILGK